MTEQEKIDVAFRVIADHLRTLSFAIADGIQPGNSDRNYTLRRILRRAVKYGRTLEFKEPFFYKLVDVIAQHMGDVFPELRTKKEQVKAVLKLEEEAFNRTLDKGIALFEDEAARLAGIGEDGPPARPSEHPASESKAPGARYWKRHLPHYERPHGIYHISYSTKNRRVLTPASRTIVLDSWKHFHNQRYDLLAVCVMPDHVHVIIQPHVKAGDVSGDPVFWGLDEILHSIKSFSANEFNKAENTAGTNVWEDEACDRLMRSDLDLEEKFLYVCRNPLEGGLVGADEKYEWLWTWTGMERGNDARRMLAETGKMPVLPNSFISGAFAFKLYDEQGFPLDLTELMARERGLTVDTAGFEKLMEEQKQRAREAGKKNKQVISVSEIETKAPTRFIGYDSLEADVRVLEVVSMKDKNAVVLDVSTCYAEMGGQVGDAGQLILGANTFPISATTKVGNTWLHFLEGDETPAVDATVRLVVDAPRRRAIERHHTVTHILHWALHEVVSKDATQKGSSVTPDKLTFDFNSAALTAQQLSDIERLVNERIVANDSVSWSEVPYVEAKANHGIMALFGEKYGDLVRVVQIGGQSHKLDGWSMELCGGTHTRGTGEIGLFRLVGESAVAAGVRRIEAIAGLEAYNAARSDADLLKTIAGKVSAQGTHDLEKKIEALLEQQKTLEKNLKAAQQREASARAKELLASASNDAIIANLGAVDGDYVMAVNDALKSQFNGIIILGGSFNGAVVLTANVDKEFQARVQAGKIIQTIAPIVGGKGGGKPDFARGGGKVADKLEDALAEARKIVG